MVHYYCESSFYNAYANTARIYDEDFETITKSPEDWALVMFDYHI